MHLPRHFDGDATTLPYARLATLGECLPIFSRPFVYPIPDGLTDHIFNPQTMLYVRRMQLRYVDNMIPCINNLNNHLSAPWMIFSRIFISVSLKFSRMIPNGLSYLPPNIAVSVFRPRAPRTACELEQANCSKVVFFFRAGG